MKDRNSQKNGFILRSFEFIRNHCRLNLFTNISYSAIVWGKNYKNSKFTKQIDLLQTRAVVEKQCWYAA